MHHRIDTVVVGGGHAGLATSRRLTDAGIEHVVLERGRVAERWRSERWPGLRLLTPNWMSRLPGWEYAGVDPDGFMTAGELVRHLERYAASFGAPLQQASVRRVERIGDRFRIATDGGTWSARCVVVTTGYCHRPVVPAAAAGLGAGLLQLDPLTYRGPASVRPGGVLVVGAASSGVQIAAELRRAGRDVLLSVGRHTRLPRRYRGRDVLAWLDLLGSLDRTLDELPEGRARREPSMQLVGGTHDVDLGVLRRSGVQLTGRLLAVDGGRAHFADDLAETTGDADRRLRRLLARIDARAGEAPRTPVAPVLLDADRTRLDLADVGTVVWATGLRGAWPWLRLPVVSGGRIVQRRGRTAVPGLHTVGQRFQHRRSSSLIDGVRHDVEDVVADVVSTLTATTSGALRAG